MISWGVREGESASKAAGGGKWLAVCVATVVVAAMAAAGAARSAVAPRSGQATAVAWAATVCSSINAWHHVVERDARALQALSASQPFPVDRLSSILDELAARTATLRAKVVGAGTPAIGSGAAMASAVLSPIAAASKDLAARRARARRLGTPAGSALSATAKQVADRALLHSDRVGLAFVQLGTTYHSAELNAALDQVPACELVHG